MASSNRSSRRASQRSSNRSSKRNSGRSATGGGRVTPKKSDRATESNGPEASTRYTPPGQSGRPPSPGWLPILMLVLFVVGVLVIFLHYVDVVLPAASSNWWLLGGLGSILAGILTATQYR